LCNEHWRFGATAAVTPQKRQCEIETLYPAASSVEAATAPSRWDDIGKSTDCTTEKSCNQDLQ